LCPYTLNSNLWEISVAPFEKQLRDSTVEWETLFPGIGFHEFVVLTLVYESHGMRWYEGLGVVKEEQRPRPEQVHVATYHPSMDTNVAPNTAGEPGTLEWNPGDSSGTSASTALYYSESPNLIVGGREILITFPFAPSGNEPLAEGVVNSADFQLPVTGDICPAESLKYMGCAKEASVVIPAVGISTGLIRYRKTYIFHYLNAMVGAQGVRLNWNWYWRARTQTVCRLKDMYGETYYQHTPVSFDVNWWL
jgi:hypothetical protein